MSAFSEMPSDLLAELRVVAAQEERRERRDVLDALAQRRQRDRDHAQAEVEVLAEPAFLHRLVEVDVGGGDQAEVGLDRAGAADALDLALLNRAQQLGLQVEPQVADLVEEERAAGGELELADLLADRAGERALLVAEEHAFDQVLRNRRQVHGDKRTVRRRRPRDAAAAPAAPCRCRSRRASAPSPSSGATRCTRSTTSRNARLGPTMNSRSVVSEASADSTCTCRVSDCRSRARATSARTVSAPADLGREVKRAQLHRFDRGIDVGRPRR